MANAFATPRIFQDAFMTALAEQPTAFTRAGRVRTGLPGTYQIGGIMAGGLAQTVADTDSSVTETPISTIASSAVTTHRVIKHKVPKHVLAQDYALEGWGQQLASDCAVNMSKDYFDFLEGLFAAAHPRAGAGAFQVGAGKKYIDSGLAYLATVGGAGTQDNLLTAAFSESALSSAYQLMLKYKTDRGVPLHLGTSGGLVLVVGPKNLQTANEVVKSQLSGSDMASNMFNGLIKDIVCWNFTTDEDDWFLISDPASPSCPVGTYIAQAPSVYASPSDDLQFVNLVAEYTSGCFKAPLEAGIVGSNVA